MTKQPLSPRQRKAHLHSYHKPPVKRAFDRLKERRGIKNNARLVEILFNQDPQFRQLREEEEAYERSKQIEDQRFAEQVREDIKGV